MFAGVDGETKSTQAQPAASIPDALSAGLLKKREGDVSFPASQSVPGLESAINPMSYKMSSPILGKIIFFVIVAALLGGLGFGGLMLYTKFMKPVPPAQKSVQVETKTEEPKLVAPAAIPTPVVPELQNTQAATSGISTKMNNDQILFGEPIDNDKDGLDDIREQELGTSITSADTDNDGLSDREEVVTWKTNPLNPDTDGDSYPDGTEVKNNYNPLGPGKVFNQSANTSSAR